MAHPNQQEIPRDNPDLQQRMETMITKLDEIFFSKITESDTAQLKIWQPGGDTFQRPNSEDLKFLNTSITRNCLVQIDGTQYSVSISASPFHPFRKRIYTFRIIPINGSLEEGNVPPKTYQEYRIQRNAKLKDGHDGEFEDVFRHEPLVEVSHYATEKVSEEKDSRQTSPMDETQIALFDRIISEAFRGLSGDVRSVAFPVKNDFHDANFAELVESLPAEMNDDDTPSETEYYALKTNSLLRRFRVDDALLATSISLLDLYQTSPENNAAYNHPNLYDGTRGNEHADWFDTAASVSVMPVCIDGVIYEMTLSTSTFKNKGNSSRATRDNVTNIQLRPLQHDGQRNGSTLNLRNTMEGATPKSVEIDVNGTTIFSAELTFLRSALERAAPHLFAEDGELTQYKDRQCFFRITGRPQDGVRLLGMFNNAAELLNRVGFIADSGTVENIKARNRARAVSACAELAS